MDVARTRVRVKGTGNYLKTFASAAPTTDSRGAPGAAYDSASQQGRMQVWKWTSGGPNRAMLGSLSTLRSRSRDFARRNGVADNALEMLTTLVIRYGIKPQWNTGNKELDKQLATLFRRWCWEADAAGRLDFYGMQALAFLSMCAGGDVFARLRTRFARDGLSVPLQIQLLESEFVPHDKNETLSDSGNEIKGGVEFDKNVRDRRVAYWMYRQHPEDDSILGRSMATPVRVPAEEIIHLAQIKRPGQVRGEPVLARSLAKMRDFDLVNDALVQKMMLQAMFAGFIQPQIDQSKPFPLVEDAGDGTGQGPLQPGTIQALEPGETITWSQPPEVGQTYDVWLKSEMRLIARDSYLLYEQLSGDYSQLNDRTLRAALNDQDGHVHRLQHHLMIPQFCIPIVQRWVQYAIAFGPIQVPAGVDMADVMFPKWVPAPRPYIHPQQDIMSKILEIRGGLASRSEKVSEMGYDAADVDAETAADRAREDALDLTYDTNGNKVASNGAMQQDPAEQQSQDDNGNQPPNSGAKR